MWVLWLALMYFVYRMKKPDLFMLAEGCLSIITVIVSFVGKNILDHDEAGGFLLIAILVIGMGSGAAFWLKSVNRELNND